MPSENMDERRIYSGSSSYFPENRFPHKQMRKPDHVADTSERNIGVSTTSWRAGDQDFGLRSDLFVQPASRFVDGNKIGLNRIHDEASLFSSSFEESFDNKLKISSKNVTLGQSVDTAKQNFGKDKPFEPLEECDTHSLADLLPDNDDLLSGVLDDLEYVAQPNAGEEYDDIFRYDGGMELEADDSFSPSKSSDSFGGVVSNEQQESLNNPYATGHLYGEHPSRTLFVRNINVTIEDAELKTLFEQFGDVRTLYTACKSRGFVMVSYFDIRAAWNAKKALQNKSLWHRKLDLHFSYPKDNPSEKDINQGTLVMFNLDSSVSHDMICQMFGVYGEIKQIRETPNKQHHKFIEFYDVRAAEAALHSLNRIDIAGKKIKLEPSRPGGARRCSTQQMCTELDLEESGVSRQHGIPTNSPSGCYGSFPLGAVNSSSLDNAAVQSPHSANREPNHPYMGTAFPRLPTRVESLSSPIRVEPVGSPRNMLGFRDLSHSLGQKNFGYQHIPTFHPHSLPEHPEGFQYVLHNPSTMGATSRHPEGIDTRFVNTVRPGSLSGDAFERTEGAFGVPSTDGFPLNGHQYTRNSSSTYYRHPRGPMMWPGSPAFVNSIPSYPLQQVHGVPAPPPRTMNTVRPFQHLSPEITSNPLYWRLRAAFLREATDQSALLTHSPANKELSVNCPMHPQELVPRNNFHADANNIDPTHIGSPTPRQRCHFSRRKSAFDVSNDQGDNAVKYELDVGRISRGEDFRTTLMIKNIPNKYTAKMLLAVIDECHRGTYDFIYLPIDFKNKCNVGYAFINMIDPQQIIPFYQVFHGKRWEKFNSEKVASLAYARIQGKSALVAHFQNSSLMNEDKRCRPILFHSDGPNVGGQEPFPVGDNVRSRPGRVRTANFEESPEGSPLNEEGDFYGSCS